MRKSRFIIYDILVKIVKTYILLSTLVLIGISLRAFYLFTIENAHLWWQAIAAATPGLLLTTIKILGVYLLTALVCTAIFYLILPTVGKLVGTNHKQTFDPESSISVSQYRQLDGFLGYLFKSLIFIALGGATVYIKDLVSNWYLYGVGGAMFFGGAVSLLLLRSTLKWGAPERTYYPKTEPLFRFYLKMLGCDEFDDEAKALFDQVDKTSTDYQIALDMRDRALGKSYERRVDYNYISGGDPTIEYGPPDSQAAFEEIEKYSNSNVRVG